jgi:pimeloyl-ACP methyl ester carboxylesterase
MDNADDDNGGHAATSRRALLAGGGAALLATLTPAPVRALDYRSTGFVLVHGKAGGAHLIAPLAQALRARGARVATPTMSWLRGFRTYDETLDEIGAAVAGLQRAGVSRIVLGGHSLGSNLSIGYAARRGGVVLVLAMAHGHRPDFIARVTGDSLARARAMVAAGQGRQKAQFDDFNQGRTYPITTTAQAYLDFFDPSGPAGQAARGNAGGTRVLWVVGTGDRPAMNDSASSFGQRIVVEANHQTTPRVALPQIMAWLDQA